MRPTRSLLPTLPLAAGLVALFLAAPARAELVVAESLDWLVLSRPHVAVAEVVAVEDVGPDAEGYSQRTTRLRRTQALKGEPPEEADRREYIAKAGEGGGPAKGASFLLFFDAQKQLNYAVNLDSPGSRWHAAAYSTDFRVLGDRKAIMEVVDKRLKQKDDPPKEAARGEPANVFTVQDRFLRLEVPFDSPAHAALYAGSACYLVVPADPEHKAGLLEKLRDPETYDRAQAAARVGAYPGEETVEALKPLLNDPGVQEVQETQTTAEGERRVRKLTLYPVRQAAYHSLRRLGVDVPKPEGYLEGYVNPAW